MYSPTEEELKPLLTFARTTAFRTWEKLHPKPPLDDLISEANFGIAKAVKNFNPTKGVPFGAYTTKCIKWALGEYIREIFGNRLNTDGSKSFKIRLRNFTSLDAVKNKFYKEGYVSGLSIKNKLNAIPTELHPVVEAILAGNTQLEVKKITKCGTKTYTKGLSILKEIAKDEHLYRFKRSRKLRSES